jgi:hypothetical protein
MDHPKDLVRIRFGHPMEDAVRESARASTSIRGSASVGT